MVRENRIVRSLALACLLAVTSRSLAVDLYWDRDGNSSTALGGNGNWLDGSAWRDGSSTGTLRNWASNANGFFTGTPGTVTVNNSGSTTPIVAGTLTFKVSSYVLQPQNSTSITSFLRGNLALDPSVNLYLMSAATTASQSLSLGGSISGGSNATVTVQAGEANTFNQVSLQPPTSGTVNLAVPIVITGANAAYAGIVSNSVGAKISAGISNNSASTLMLAANTGYDLDVAGPISGSGNVTFSANVDGGNDGGGIIVLSGKSTYSGKTTIGFTTSGTLKLGVSDALPTTTAVAFGIKTNAGTLDLNNFNQTIGSLESTVVNSTRYTGVIANYAATAGTSVLTVDGSGSTSYSGLILDNGVAKLAVVKDGTGTLSLRGDNRYNGATTLRDGTLELASGGSITRSPVELAGGTLAITANHATTSLNSVSVTSGASAITSLGTQSNIFALGPITRLSGATVAITPTTAGTMTTTTGNAAGGIIGGWATVGGSTWAVSAANASAGAISGLTTYGSTYSAATTATNFDATGNGTFAASGVNSLRFNAASPAAATLPGGAFVVGSGGVLVTSVVGSNAAAITGGTLTSGNGSDLIVHQHNPLATFSIDSAIANNGNVAIGLTKSGAGTLAVSGANTFSGTTTVNAGRLLANTPVAVGSATGSGAVIVHNGGQLAGSGHIAGNVTIEDGGILSAGSGTGTSAMATDTVGTLSTGGQTWQAGGTLRIKYAGGTTAASAGTGYDALSMPTLNLSDLAASGGVFKVVLLKMPGTTFDSTQATQLRLASVGQIFLTPGGPAVGANVDLSQYFALDTSSLGIPDGLIGSSFHVQSASDGSGLMLSNVQSESAPEPTTAVLTLMAGGALLGRRRRVR